MRDGAKRTGLARDASSRFSVPRQKKLLRSHGRAGLRGANTHISLEALNFFPDENKALEARNPLLLAKFLTPLKVDFVALPNPLFQERIPVR
jgi:hypothetical protein